MQKEAKCMPWPTGQQKEKPYIQELDVCFRLLGLAQHNIMEEVA